MEISEGSASAGAGPHGLSALAAVDEIGEFAAGRRVTANGRSSEHKPRPAARRRQDRRARPRGLAGGPGGRSRNGLPAGARGLAGPDGRDLSPRPHGLSPTAISISRSPMCARPARRRARRPSISATSPRCAGRRACSPRASRRRGARSRSPRTSRAAWNNLGIVLQEALKLDESRLCLERALALEPNNAADAQQSRQHAQAPRPRGGSGEALDAPRSRSSPTTPRPTATSPTCCNDQGEYDRAEASARRAIELNPRLADAYVNLAGGRRPRATPCRRPACARRAARLCAGASARARGARRWR